MEEGLEVEAGSFNPTSSVPGACPGVESRRIATESAGATSLKLPPIPPKLAIPSPPARSSRIGLLTPEMQDDIFIEIDSHYGLAMAIASEEILLERLPKGARARVAAVRGNDQEVARISELGLHEGVLITVLRRGSPCLVQLNAFKIGLRPSRELSIWVNPID